MPYQGLPDPPVEADPTRRHDMGLIGAWLGTMYFAVPLVLMSPATFLARPARWLRTIHCYGATISAGPNFAYEIAASKIRDEDLESLDLRAWRIAFNGAEPVRAATLERFASRFARRNRCAVSRGNILESARTCRVSHGRFRSQCGGRGSHRSRRASRNPFGAARASLASRPLFDRGQRAPPIMADGRDWSAAARLRDRAREVMLRHCGEPDLTR